MKAVERFRALAAEERFKGWPLVGEYTLGDKIPFFGQTLNYKLQTGNGVEDYTSIIRHFGWAVVFGVVNLPENESLVTERELPRTGHNGHVITLCQWKPGVNQASWELPPGGIGKTPPDITEEALLQRTKDSYLKETGYGEGTWTYLGRVMIETGKFRGAGSDDHGLPAHLFLATGLQKMADARKPNPNEIMETLLVPLGEFKDVLRSGQFVETSAVACAWSALDKLGI